MSLEQYDSYVIFPVTEAEARMLRSVMTRIVVESFEPVDGVSSWGNYERLMEAKAKADDIVFKLDDPQEESMLRKFAKNVGFDETRAGTYAMLSPQSANAALDAIAQMKHPEWDVPIAQNIVRKIAQFFRRQPPKIEQEGQSIASAARIEQGSAYPGAEAARMAPTEQDTEHHMSEKDFEELMAGTYASRYGKDQEAGLADPDEDLEELEPIPEVPGQFQPGAQRVMLGQHEVPMPAAPAAPQAPVQPQASRAARVAAQDVAGAAGATSAGPTDWRAGTTTVRDPKEQEKTADTEAGTKDLMSIFDESRRLLSKKSAWRM